MAEEQVVGLLDHRFRLLTGGQRSVVERHQTLRAAIDWSYDLLSGAERGSAMSEISGSNLYPPSRYQHSVDGLLPNVTIRAFEPEPGKTDAFNRTSS